LDGVELGVGLELIFHLNRRRNDREAEIRGFRENTTLRYLDPSPVSARVHRSFQNWQDACNTVCLGQGCAWRRSRAYLSSQPKTQWPGCRDQWIPRIPWLFVTSIHSQPPHVRVGPFKAGRALTGRYTLAAVVFDQGLELTFFSTEDEMVDRQRSVDSAITLAFRQLSHYPAPARARTSFQSWLSARNTSCLKQGCARRRSRAYLLSQPKTQWLRCRDQWIPRKYCFLSTRSTPSPRTCV
jgi:hypothetical protein